MLIWEPKPAARCSAYLTGYSPPAARLSGPSEGSTSLKLATGGTIPVSSALTARTSSTPTVSVCPVWPLALAMTILSALGPNTRRRAVTSAEALPPRAGV